MYLKNNQKGFSLVEIMIGIAIMLIILIPILASLFSGLSAYRYTLSQSSNNTSAINIFNTISEEIIYAETASVISSSEIDYKNNQAGNTYSGKIYVDKNSIIIERDGKQYKKLAAGITKILTFTQDATIKNKITVEIKLNDNSYTKSPDLGISNATIVLLNMKKD